MPPKRKTGRGGGRPKRPRELSPVAKGSGEQVQKRQRVDDNSATAAPDVAEESSSKVLDKALFGEGDEDADGEDDKGATRDEDVGESQVLGHPNAEQEHGEDQYMEHEVVKEGGEDNHQDDEGDSAEPLPSRSTRGRGRGRGRRARGAGAGRTRSSPRKVTQETQAQSTSNPPNVRGRKATRGRGRGKGVAASNHPPSDVPAAEEASANSGGEGEAEVEKVGEGESEVPQHQPLSQPPSPQHQFQDDHSQRQQSNQIPVVDHTPQPPSGTFPPQPHPYYPSYPSHASPFQYAYVAPPPTTASTAPDGRPYLPLRPDGAQPIYGTSFATTVGTVNGTGSASSSFNAPYPTPGAAVQSLDANAPQGNPFPPSAPVPIPAYGTAVYSVGVSDDDDDDQEQQQEHSGIGGHMEPGKKKAQPAVKAGGRAGRGDHVACHFCRGRKLKCDGRRPTCGHCALRSLACKYDDAVRRRGPGRKEKNNRRERNGAGNRRTTGGVVVTDLSVGPQTPTQSHSQLTTPSTEGVKRKRRPPVHPHISHSQTSIIRFDDTDGTSVPGPGMKPASAAYGVDNNERLGYYYAGGPQYGPPYSPYGGYEHAGNTHSHPPQAAYYAQDGGEEGDGNAEMEGEGEGDGDHEVYGSRQGENASYGQPPNESYSNAWPAEPPGGVPVSHPHGQHM